MSVTVLGKVFESFSEMSQAAWNEHKIDCYKEAENDEEFEEAAKELEYMMTKDNLTWEV